MIDSPIVMFKDINVEQVVSYWLGIDIDYVNTYLGLILYELGFSNEDNIYVYGYTKESYLCFRVNDSEEHRILMSSIKRDDKYNPVVYYDKDKIEDGYECRINRYGNFDIDFIRVKYTDEEINRMIDTESSYEEIKVTNGEYIIEFTISKVGNGIYNKNEVVNYLNSLIFPVSILDVYKEICEISLVNDVSCYSLIDLRIVNKDNEIVDMINISDGKLVNLLINKDGKKVFCDYAGNFTYETDKVGVDFSVSRVNGIIDFSSKVRPKEDIDNYSLDLASHDINTAKKEITNVRRLVKRIFDK